MNRRKDCFQQMFLLHYKELVRYAHSYLFDQSECEDVVQEVFLHIWENRNSIKIKTSLKAYMQVMVRNKCLNHLRDIKITDNEEVLLKLTEIEFEEETENRQLISSKLSEIMHIVKSMPACMREVFELKYFSNYSYSEIASELQISPNTVKTQLQRAKTRILNVVGPFFTLIFFIFL